MTVSRFCSIHTVYRYLIFNLLKTSHNTTTFVLFHFSFSSQADSDFMLHLCQTGFKEYMGCSMSYNVLRLSRRGGLYKPVVVILHTPLSNEVVFLT